MLDSDDLLASVEPLDASRGGRSRGRVGNGGGSIDLPAPETLRESGRIGEIHLSLLPLRSCTAESVACLGIGRRCCVDFAAGWGSILRRREPLLGWILEDVGFSMADEGMIWCERLNVAGSLRRMICLPDYLLIGGVARWPKYLAYLLHHYMGARNGRSDTWISSALACNDKDQN